MGVSRRSHILSLIGLIDYNARHVAEMAKKVNDDVSKGEPEKVVRTFVKGGLLAIRCGVDELVNCLEEAEELAKDWK